MVGRIAGRMRVQGAILCARLRDLANSALEETDIAVGIGVHAELNSCISPPLRLLAPRAIDICVEHAIPLRLAADAPDFGQSRIAAFEIAEGFESGVDLA